MHKRLSIVCFNENLDYVGTIYSPVYSIWINDPCSKHLFIDGGHVELNKDDCSIGEPIKDYDDMVSKVERISAQEGRGY